MRGYNAGFGACFEKREIEFLGLNIKPELSIGDIAAIGALIASPLIFYFGYSRTRKSEQIKMAREIKDRINLKIESLSEFRNKNLNLLYKRESESVEERTERLRKGISFLTETGSVLNEIYYFSWFIKNREINDKTLISYYESGITGAIVPVIGICKALEETLEPHRSGPVYFEGIDLLPIFKSYLQNQYELIDKIKKVWHIPDDEVILRSIGIKERSE